MDLVLLGAPGAGKGTQAERLEQWLGIPRISSGDLFRSNIARGTALGQQAQAYIDQGVLVPDEVTIGMVAARLAEPDCQAGVILDGFPRTVAQAQALDEILAKMGRRVDLALYIAVSREMLLARLAGRWTCKGCGAIYHELYRPPKRPGVCDECGGELYQRSDDTVETQARRIDVYVEETSPLIAYYQERGVLVQIDGEQGIDQVEATLRSAVTDVTEEA
ncbi:MAG: adenylate kinase [Anaerolineae bacterium]|nr:adenylate kinase [Anaerolineae bacterium]